MSIPSLTRCPDCWQPVNRCCCTEEEAARAEQASLHPYVAPVLKSVGVDWLSEGRLPLHRVQQEESDGD